MKNMMLELATSYYRCLESKDAKAVTEYLHPELVVVSPLDTVEGAAAIRSVTQFMKMYQSLRVRRILTEGDQAMVTYHVAFPEPIGTLPSMASVQSRDGKLVRIELYYDARPVEKYAEVIFGS